MQALTHLEEAETIIEVIFWINTPIMVFNWSLIFTNGEKRNHKSYSEID